MILCNGIELYHASYKIVDKIDLSKCNPGKDFGTGFYLTRTKKAIDALVFQNSKIIKIEGR